MNHYYPFVNTPLPYDYSALEPFIDEKTMHLHHDRHLQTYIDNLNKLLEENPSLRRFSLEELLIHWCRLPRPLQTPVRNNAGGVFNHRFYFDGMSPARMPRTSAPSCSCPREIPGLGNQTAFSEELSRYFGGPKEFQAQFKEAALSVFGSGYAWLVAENRRLVITTSANQDTPLSKNQYPLLNIDVWEHAYYLKHYNVRAAYIDDWLRVVNWRMVEERFYQQMDRNCCQSTACRP